MLERLQSIRPRLEELARLDPNFRLFGSRTHRYHLSPPLTPDEVAAFELFHGVFLPDDYRAFLLEVGSEGAGPYYGLSPLGNFEHAESASDEAHNFLVSPFPHRTQFNLLNDEFRHRCAQASEEEEAALWSRFETEYFKDTWVFGTLCLAHEGCGMYDFLVVSGEERGSIWIDDRCNNGGLSPLQSNRFPDRTNENALFLRVNAAHTSFLDWYEWWLDWSLREAKEATT